MKDHELDELLKLSDKDAILNGFSTYLLKNLLEDLVEKERYELAVVIRDHLKKREGEVPNA